MQPGQAGTSPRAGLAPALRACCHRRPGGRCRRRRGRPLEAGLVEQLITETLGRAGALPLLELSLAPEALGEELAKAPGSGARGGRGQAGVTRAADVADSPSAAYGAVMVV